MIKLLLLIFISLAISQKQPTGLFYNSKDCSGPYGVRQYKNDYCAQRVKGASVYEKGVCNGDKLTISRCSDDKCTKNCSSNAMPNSCLANPFFVGSASFHCRLKLLYYS
jgi:hypothetical protein